MKRNLSAPRRLFKPARQRTIRKTPHVRLRLEPLETRLAPANVPILSGHYDPLLTGWNSQETALSPTTVNDAGFGKLFNYTVDGYTYAQPLYVPNLTIPGKGGGTFNVVFAATEHDSLYAFNADAQTGGPANDGVLWKRSFIDPANGINTMPAVETLSSDVVPEVGITGTPVIDSATNTLYVLAKTKEIRAADPASAHYVQKLYAIDITTGNNRASNGVVTIGDTAYVNGTNTFVSNTTTISVPGTGAGNVNGVVQFDARKENDRMSFQLVPNSDGSKTVYLAWASHGDNGPYHGWIVGYNASDLALKKVFNTSPNGSASGIWESGGNLGFDSQGNLYFATGNGFGTGFNFNTGGPTALGAGGGALGYSGGSKILNSVSIRFRTFPTNTGLGANGDFGPDVALPSSFDFNAAAQAGDTFSVTLSDNASTKVLTETITNTNHPTQTFTTTYNIDIPATVGGSTAYVGFTGGSGGLNAEQDIKTWLFTPATGAGVNHSAGFANSSDLTANGGASLPAYTAPSPVGAFQFHQDLGIPGDPTPAGAASFNAGAYTLTASGTDIGFKATQYDTDTDRMQFVYNPVTLSATQDSDIIVRVHSLTNTDFWTKAALMIRQSLDPQADNVASIVSPHNVSEMTWRNNPPSIDNNGNQAPGLTGAQERGTGTAPLPDVWIRLVHVHGTNTFKSFWAVDNNGTPGAWQGEIDHDVAMTGEVYVGIGLSAHANGKTATAVFDNLSMTGFDPRTQDPSAILTPAANNQAGSIFANNKVDVSGNWSTTFTFRLKAGSNPVADGLTFTIQNAPAGTEISESVLKLSPTGAGTGMSVADYFTPHDWRLLDGQDADLGSGGTLLLPDAVGSAAHPHLMVETGKTGRLYLIDRDNMGKFETRYDQIVQIVTLGGTNQTPGVWGNPAFFQDGPNTGLLYYWGSSAPGQAFRITNGVINPIPVSITTNSPTTVPGRPTDGRSNFPGTQPSISSNGMTGNSGIMWALRSDGYGINGTEILYAYSAEDLTNLLWSSTDVQARDEVGGSSVKFTMPIVSNGHVFAGANGTLAVYGLLAPHAAVPAAPTNLQVTQIPPLQGGDTKLQLSWNAQADGTLFKIERSSTSAATGFTQIAEVGGNQTSFTDTGLTPLTQYWYRIKATNQAGDSTNYSNVGTAFTHLAGAKLVLTNVASADIDLSWSSVLATNSGNTYSVERSTDSFATFTTLASNLPAAQTTFADTTPVVGTTYQYRVHAFNVNPAPADQSFSNVVVATDAPVDIEFPFPGQIQNVVGLQLNGSASFSPTEQLIRLTDNQIQAGSVFTNNRVDTSLFSTTFWVRVHEGTQPSPADGFTFTIQSNSPASLGGVAGGLGYSGIPKSVAIKFNFFNQNTTGLYTNGQSPSGGTAIDPTVVNLGDQHRKRVDISYDASTLVLTVTITDEQHAGGPTSVTQTYSVNIPSIVGPGGAYVGFTGGTGGFSANGTGALYSLQDILGWVFPPTAPAGPDNLTATINNPTDITLNWKDHATGELGYTVERSLDNYHFDLLATLGVGANSFHDAAAPSNAIIFYRVRAFNAQGVSSFATLAVNNSTTPPVVIDHSAGFASHGDLQANGNATFIDPAPATGTLGAFTANQDVGPAGDPGTAGTATFDNSASKYTLTASGSDIWDVADHMQFVYKPMTSDGEIVARVINVNNTDYWSKAGLMIRTDTTAGAQDAFMLETGGNPGFAHNEPVFQWRPSAGGGTSDSGNHPGNDVGIKAPIWLRLVRSGNTFTGYWAVDINNGQSHGSWQNIGGTQTVPIGLNADGSYRTLLVGLGLTAHNNGTVASATFDHVSVVTAARLTDTQNNQASSLFATQKVPITGSFTTSWVMNLRSNNGSSNAADGVTFTIQNDAAGAGALGQGGGGLGYATDTVGGAQGIHPSVMIKFDMFSQGSHHATTGLYVNGESPNTLSKQVDMSGAGIDFTQNHTYQVDLVYDGLTLNETVKDLVSGKSFSTTYTIGIRDTIGSDTAYVGFTGGTGGQNAWETIESWTASFNPLAAPPHLELHYPTARSGAPQVFTVSARTASGGLVGSYRGTVHFSSSDPNAILPDDYTFNAADNGQHSFAGVLFNVGTDSITVTDNSPAPFADAPAIVVTPRSFSLSDFPSEVTAGDTDDFTVVALDYFGNVATGYAGKVHFTSTDAKAGLPANYTFTADDAGTHSFSATLFTAGTQSLTVSDTLAPTSSKGTEDGILVDPAAVSTFIVSGYPSSTKAGDAHNFTVTAKDAFGNTATNYTGTVHFSSSDTSPNASLPPDGTLTNGVGTFSATLVTAGTRSITVTDTATGVTGSEDGILVNPGAAVGFRVQVLVDPVSAGNPDMVFVSAVDLYGNEGAVYTGTVHLSSSDGAADMPPNYQFTTGDHGNKVFGVTFRTRGHQSVTVTDTVDPTITGSGDVDVV
jgi:hypothetical protein